MDDGKTEKRAVAREIHRRRGKLTAFLSSEGFLFCPQGRAGGESDGQREGNDLDQLHLSQVADVEIRHEVCAMSCAKKKTQRHGEERRGQSIQALPEELVPHVVGHKTRSPFLASYLLAQT
eukprot:761937-Hanusia_phi.AAC.3